MTRVAIAGGGASGALVAANLLRLGDSSLEVVVVEPRTELGQGVAYSTTEPWHRLNVPVAGMSGIADDPDHFQRWSGAPAEAFLSRLDYGRYLGEVLADAVASSPARLRHVRSTVERVRGDGQGVRVTLAAGEEVSADALVLATGVELPPRLTYLEPLLGDPRVILDPWAPGALDAVRDGETVAIIGSSLTAIDVTGSILLTRPRATVVALSRHGNLPLPHEDPWRPKLPEPVFTVDEFHSFDSPFQRAVERVRSYGDDWPRAVDSLRPITQALWQSFDQPMRREFLTNYRNLWDTHRHRVAPSVARDLERWTGEGRFVVKAAAISGIDSVGSGLRVVAPDSRFDVDRIVVAVGPDPDATASPLLGSAIRDGLLRPGLEGIAIDVDPVTGRVLDALGEPRLPAYAIGALRKGALWETLAMPEIRVQAADVASRILAQP